MKYKLFDTQDGEIYIECTDNQSLYLETQEGFSYSGFSYKDYEIDEGDPQMSQEELILKFPGIVDYYIITYSTWNFYDYVGDENSGVVCNKNEVNQKLTEIWEGEFYDEYPSEMEDYIKLVKSGGTYHGKPSFGFGTLKVELEKIEK